MYSIFMKWLAFAPASIFMAIFSKLMCPVFPFFVCKDTKMLPKWLDWFQTPDNTADGDEAHQQRHPGNDWWSTYKRRTAWFWRNSAYGFDRQVIGIEYYDSDYLEIDGNPNVNRKPFVPGVVTRKLYSKNGTPKAWHYYFCLPWPFGLFKTKCIRGNFGWKLWGKQSDGHGVAQWTGMCNPFFNRE